MLFLFLFYTNSIEESITSFIVFELVVFGYEFRQNVKRLNHMAYCVINEREVY